LTLSIIIPVINEAARLTELASELLPAKRAGAEVIVVDGGSTDGSAEIAASFAKVVNAPRGRALQMNAGAAGAQGETLLFLHADSALPQNAHALIDTATRGQLHSWGRFDVVIEGRSAWLPVIAWFMNQRSRLTGIATGDQGLFMTRAAFERVGGYAPVPLMEDVAMSAALKRLAPPACLRARIRTSGRRWDTRGALRTILLMWRLRFDYWRGVPADQLHARYYGQ
jgi:rSAM/selenodomain-associated transferase 2